MTLVNKIWQSSSRITEKNYTGGKEETIQRLLAEAGTWKANLLKTGNYK